MDRCGDPLPSTQVLTTGAAAGGGRLHGEGADTRAHGRGRGRGLRQQQQQQQQAPPRHLVPAALLCALKALEHQSRSKTGLKHTAVDSLVGLLIDIHHTFRQPVLPPALGSTADAAAGHTSTTATTSSSSSSAAATLRRCALSGDFGASGRKGSILAPDHVRVLAFSNRLYPPRCLLFTSPTPKFLTPYPPSQPPLKVLRVVLCNGLEHAMARTDAVVGAVAGGGVGGWGSCEDIINHWEDVRRSLLLALR
jgi:hypothetical protein